MELSRNNAGTTMASEPRNPSPENAESPHSDAADQTTRMKAVHAPTYGSPTALSVKELPVPTAGRHEVLIRVQSAALHAGDCFAVRGRPLLMRMETGWRKPKTGIPGFDMAGYVETVGPQVTGFQPGDPVFGVARGSCAEFTIASAEHLAPMPVDLSFAEAAALPTSGLAALHAIRDVACLQPGQHILINGAAGGVGTFAVQIAKSFGAQVTGVCSSANVELVRSIGADHVIDYSREDFTLGPHEYDVIFDNVENRTLADCRRALKSRGMLILNSGTGAKGMKLLVRIFKPLFLSPFVGHRLRRYLSTPKQQDLMALKQLVESGQVRPVLGKRYSLANAGKAIEHIESGHARGKVTIDIVESGSPPTDADSAGGQPD